ncbi:MAG: NYN domain-containing protein [Candidatus Krumholzibacteriia bacterium]
MPDRAIVFIDGNNWYHSLRSIGVVAPGRLDYARIAHKLVGPRTWLGTRYYIGRVPHSGDLRLYADQRRYFDWLIKRFPQIQVFWGRIEERPTQNEAAAELRRYLHGLTVRLDPQIYRDLFRIADKHSTTTVLTEKAVDVHVAVDLAVMAERDEYDAAYLLSADGDFTPAVRAALDCGKKVYVASPVEGAALAAIATTYIRLKREWFADCYLP